MGRGDHSRHRWGASDVTWGPVGRTLLAVLAVVIPVLLVAPLVGNLLGGATSYDGNPFLDVLLAATGVLIAFLLPRYLADVMKPNPRYVQDQWDERRTGRALTDAIPKRDGVDLGIDEREVPHHW